MFEDLLRVIQQVKERVQAHGQVLQKSEAQTRYSLIDPLLRALDWDVSDPACVRVEFNAEPGRADYALMRADGKPVAMVEAKALDKNLKDSLTQGIAYCISGGIGYFMVTDGRRWELYETFRQVPLDQKQVVSLDIVAMPPHEVAIKSLSLWRANLSGANLVPPPPVVLLKLEQEQPVVGAVSRQTTSPASGDLTPLAQAIPGSHEKPPKVLVTPDGVSHPIDRWVHVLLETARWLSEKNILTPSKCPIRDPKTKRIAVAATPQQFRNARKVGEVYVEPHGTGQAAVRRTLLVIESLGQDPSTFRVGW